MAITKICLPMTFLISTSLLFHTVKPERNCIYPGIPLTGPLMFKAEPTIYQILQVKHDTFIKFSCKSNYILRGHKLIRCEDGRWTGRVPYCKDAVENIFQRFMNFLLYSLFKHLVFEQKEILCNDPGEIPFGKKNKKQELYRKDATVSYMCDKGYVMREATSTLRCTENGTWNRHPPKCINCKSSLGMERSGPTLIHDQNIRASTEKGHHHKANEGRLNGPRAWCSGRERTPYLEIDLGKPHKILFLSTQGSVFDDKWVGWYAVKSSLRGSLFTTYRENNQEKMFKGNTDASSILKHALKNPIAAKKNPILSDEERRLYK
ncbi:uncharacterized protein LOC116289146 [Actinia tenebrosa]|uniref:Uncharacterized protein LOC116289146 n=1 Tax=Actinia tenebrosa TaxID=6105 RepID=A0A6P8HH15_ACTTE|nr:uncharacterized protein LOC116289146 [Actinia tenebrosa]